MTRIIFQWAASSFFGWGVYGLNLALHAPAHGLTPISALPVDKLAVDRLRLEALAGFFGRTSDLCHDLRGYSGRYANADCMTLHALCGGLRYAALAAHGACIAGRPNVGVVFLEDTALDSGARQRAGDYALFVAGSTWNAGILRAAGIGPVSVVLQGVDTSLFHPAPALGLLRDRFVIFSGGKIEHRKGQDLVLRAFRIFRARHPEALLATAWHSPWTKRIAGSIPAAADLGAVPLDQNGAADVARWASENGLPPGSVLDLGAVPNALMPQVLREADAAVFASRCEGGTNLVAMEAMACGVPCVLSANTGHLDLIREGNCVPLRRQRPVAPDGRVEGTGGWGESDPEEIAEALEILWRDRAAARAMGLAGAALLAGMSWQRQIGALAAALGPHVIHTD